MGNLLLKMTGEETSCSFNMCYLIIPHQGHGIEVRELPEIQVELLVKISDRLEIRQPSITC